MDARRPVLFIGTHAEVRDYTGSEEGISQILDLCRRYDLPDVKLDDVMAASEMMDVNPHFSGHGSLPLPRLVITTGSVRTSDVMERTVDLDPSFYVKLHKLSIPCARIDPAHSSKKDGQRLQIFVRWGKNEKGEPTRGQDTVELVQNGHVIQRYSTFNNQDRVYGYCAGVVDTLTRIGVEISMPNCLADRHACADTTRED